MKPVTEMSNDITKDIDASSPTDIVQQLKQCDLEIFHGWEKSGGLLNEPFLDNLKKVIAIARTFLQGHNDYSVILSGCGTSGRLAYLITRNFNAHLLKIGKEPCFDYLIAGGDSALFTSQESPEDNPFLGRSDLEKASVGKKKILYVGITCGFSAPYVAGQLDYCMDHLDRFFPVLLGFNPLSCARTLPIENWDKTFQDVVIRLQELQRTGGGFIVNPIVGPEAICGSTRMKGGTATKILLETIFTIALFLSRDKTIDTRFLREFISLYEATCEAVYKETGNLGSLIHMGDQSLQDGGRICYLASGSAGVMCLIDASECPPTFGADVEEVRGFLDGGYSSLNNKEGDRSDQFQISIQHFLDVILPSLTRRDLIVLLNLGQPVTLPSTEAKIVSVFIRDFSEKDTELNDKENIINVALPEYSTSLEGPYFSTFLQGSQKEIAAKWLCNCLTTGGYIRNGKVFHNHMVDVRVRNNKLFERAAGIIETYCDCTKERAREVLMKSIYEIDKVPQNYKTLPVSAHVKKATPMDKVVPMALVLGITDCSVSEARKILQENPIIRTAIKKICN